MNNLIKVVTTGHYVPTRIVTNDELSKIVDTNDEWIQTRTGIKERRYASENQNSVDLAYFAALDAITKNNYDKNKIDLIVVATVTPNQKTPAVANLVQAKLKLNHKHVVSFDINAACTGFVYALEVASSLINTGNYKSALVIGSEKLSSVIDFTDRETCILFGDGAGAVIIESSENEKDSTFFYTASRGDDNDILSVKEYIKMAGKEVFKFAVDVLPRSIDSVLEKANLTIDDIDVVIPHQANMRIIANVAKTTKIPLEKFEMNIEKYGNTSAASIPILLDEYRQKGNVGKKVLLVGFGGGFTWGAAIINI